MSPEQIAEIACFLRAHPISFRRAALHYAALRLHATGEKLGDAVLLLEQIALENDP